jgi:hypothetical protein
MSFFTRRSYVVLPVNRTLLVELQERFDHNTGNVESKLGEGLHKREEPISGELQEDTVSEGCGVPDVREAHDAPVVDDVAGATH